MKWRERGGAAAEGLASSDRTLALADLAVAPVEVARFAQCDPERYVPLGEIARGGMGCVSAVFDRVLGRQVARKEALAQNVDSLIVAEAQICAQLEHPSIVPIYDLSSDEAGRPLYTMRVVRGQSFAELLSTEDRMPLAKLLGILRQVCLAIDYAHSRGVVHRDLKPDNVLVGSFGEVYVLDWGVAHVLEGSDLHRTAGLPELAIAGTPAYMSPEQLDGTIGPAVDVYALGAMLYEVLVGISPFPEASDIMSIQDRRTAPPPSRASHRSAEERRVPPAFDLLVTACLARDPGRRPTSTRAIAEAIDAFLDGERERLEHERRAADAVREGEAAWAAHEAELADAHRLDREAREKLAGLQPHDPVEAKAPIWKVAEEARRKHAEAGQTLARAEISFSNALRHVGEHPAARAGLARIHVSLFRQALRQNDRERMSLHFALARSYDDGTHAAQLEDGAELEVTADAPGAAIELVAFEPCGPLSVLGASVSLGDAPTGVRTFPRGSYLIRARTADLEIAYPIVLDPSVRKRVELRVPRRAEIPEGMVLIPGGPSSAPPTGRVDEPPAERLGDFALGRFPVTLAEYGEWLGTLGDAAEARVPRDEAPHLVRRAGAWVPSETLIAVHAGRYAPVERLGELPAHGITWFDALAYISWKSGRTGIPYRLPTAAEWTKAMRGADGRPFPMGTQLDPSFARIRQSRAEGIQLEPIGAFPLDESPYGVRDMAGGVGDWTSTMSDGRPAPTLEHEFHPRESARVALWLGSHWGSMAVRDSGVPVPQRVHHRTNGVGFRLALSLDADGSSDLVEV